MQVLTGMRISSKIQSQVGFFLLNHKEVTHECLGEKKRVNQVEQAGRCD